MIIVSIKNFQLFIQYLDSIALLCVFDTNLILSLTPAAERTEERKLEEELLDAAREGDLSSLSQLVGASCWYLIKYSQR